MPLVAVFAVDFLSSVVTLADTSVVAAVSFVATDDDDDDGDGKDIGDAADVSMLFSFFPFNL